jgi:CheY-like chemotaxis protein
MSKKRILSVGNCAADHAAITRAIQQHWDAEVISAATADDIFKEFTGAAIDLLLVNRVFDADGSDGVKVIGRLKEDARFRDVPVMLVSNYDDAQERAVESGAVRGFGKAALGQPHMLARLKPYLE